MLVGALIAGVVLISDDGKVDKATNTPTPTRTAASSVPKVVATVTVGKRPNSIANGDGTVFVTSFSNRRVALIDEKGAKLGRTGPSVGAGALDATTGFGAVWVVVGREKALYRLDPATGRRIAKIALPMEPQTVATGHGSVWVGMRSNIPGVSDELATVEQRTGQILRTVPLAEGIRTIVSTPSDLWIVHRLEAAVSRFDVRRGAVAQRISVGNSRLGDAAYGAGALWVSSPLEDSVTRIDVKTGAKVTSGVGGRPQGIAARGTQIWVANFVDHTLTRLIPTTGVPMKATVPVPPNPYALAMTADSVWVTSVGDDKVAQVRYADPG